MAKVIEDCKCAFNKAALGCLDEEDEREENTKKALKRQMVSVIGTLLF